MQSVYRARGFRLLVLAALVVGLAGCGIFGGEKKDPTANWSAKKLYEEGHSALMSGSYQTAIDDFEKLDSRYPFGIYAQQEQLEIIYAYYKNGESASAIAAAERFIKLHPRNPHVDYAYYLRGLAQFDQGRGFLDAFLPSDRAQHDPGPLRQAFDDFAELTKRFPNSKYAKDAAQRMTYLRNELAMYELNVAKYYMRRGAYLAAANRGKYVLEHYDGTTAVPGALVVMAKAYRTLKLDQLYQETMRVLKMNYPHNPDIAELEQGVALNQ